MQELEEYLQEFFRGVFYDLDPNQKGLVPVFSPVCFNYDYFIETSHPRFFLFYIICEYPQDYHFTISSDASME